MYCGVQPWHLTSIKGCGFSREFLAARDPADFTLQARAFFKAVNGRDFTKADAGADLFSGCRASGCSATMTMGLNKPGVKKAGPRDLVWACCYSSDPLCPVVENNVLSLSRGTFDGGHERVSAPG